MAMSRPLLSRQRSDVSAVSSSPARNMRPRARRTALGSSPIAVKASMLFPLPDSPTTPTTSPGSTIKETSSKIVASVPAKTVVRPCTSRTGRPTSDPHARVENVPKAVAEQVEAKNRGNDREPREQGDPRRVGNEVAALGDDAAEGWRRGRRSNADEGHGGLGQDCGREHVGKPDGEWSEGVRKDVPQQDPELCRSQRARSLHEFHLAYNQHGGAHDPSGMRSCRDREGDDNVRDRCAEHG